MKEAIIDSYERGNKSVAVKTLEVMGELNVKAVDSHVYRQVLEISGDIYLNDLKLYGRAVKTYTKLRDLASFHSVKDA